MPNPYTPRKRSSNEVSGSALGMHTIGDEQATDTKVEIELHLNDTPYFHRQKIVFVVVDPKYKHDFGFSTTSYQVEIANRKIIRIRNSGKDKSGVWHEIAERKQQ